jgi:moderate conductance mechanosensitive channel
MWHAIIVWFQVNTIPIILILIGSYLVIQFGTKFLSLLIHRTVGRIHTDVSEDDVKKRQDTLISMFSTMLKVLVWLTAGFTILQWMGINLTPLLAGAGVLGVAIGFGAQSIIKDLLSGMFIIIENQYRVGDVVDIEGAAGSVEQITIKSTIIRDGDGNVHYLPNGTIAHVINKTMGYSKVNFAIAVTADTNVDKLTEIINEVGEKLAAEKQWKDKMLEPPHFLNIGNFTDTALEARIIGKTQPSQQWAVTGELRKRLLIALAKHDIKLAQMPGVPNLFAQKKK